jgi:L-ascorbate metabolism protein UlaG (beta-lactamase superfamily)
MNIKWYGTATLVFEAEEQSIIFDPFISLNEHLPRPSFDELSAYGDIFITHGHFDHLVDVPQVLKIGNNSVYCSETAAKSLLRDGVDQKRINVIKPGDYLEKGPFKISVLRGEHIKFDPPLIIKTLFSCRTLANLSGLRKLMRKARLYPQGEVLVYLIEENGKKLLHMGSLNLSESEKYPVEIDLLTLPFQGRSDLDTYAQKFINLLKPRAIFLHHTCDSFPPVSSPVRTDNFIKLMAHYFPQIKVIKPEYRKPINIWK